MILHYFVFIEVYYKLGKEITTNEILHLKKHRWNDKRLVGFLDQSKQSMEKELFIYLKQIFEVLLFHDISSKYAFV